MRYLGAFFRFWYDFIIGDDWVIAVGVVAALGLTAVIADRGITAWWVMPVAVVALLAVSLRRGLHQSSSDAERLEPVGAAPGESKRAPVPATKGP
jgi:hypothetical protein